MSEISEFEIHEEYIKEFQIYLYEKEHAKATIDKYITDIRTFYTYMNEQKLVNKSVLLNYKEWLLNTYAISSVNSMLVALNQFLYFLNKGKMKLRRVKVQKQMFLEQDKVLTQSNYQALVKTAQKKGKEQLALIMETIASTGIRISELNFFTAEMIRTGRVKVQNKGKFRIVLIPKELRIKLLKYMKKVDISTGVIFRTRSGKAKDRSNIWKEMQSLAKDCKIDKTKIFPHNLRHLFARTFYKLTKNLVNLADILGHNSMEVTRIYTMNSLKENQKYLENVYKYVSVRKIIMQKE